MSNIIHLTEHYLMITDSRKWFILVLLVCAAWLIWLLAPVITPFALAAAFAYLGDPLVDGIERRKIWRWQISRTFAVVMVFLLLGTTIGLFLLILIPLLREQLQHLIERIPDVLEWLGATGLPWLQESLGLNSLEFDATTVTDALKAYWKEASTAAMGVLGTVSRSGQAVASWLMTIVLVPVVAFYLLRDWDRLLDAIRRLLPRPLEPKFVKIAGEIDEVLGAFIRGQLLVMSGLGLVYALGLWIIGLDLAFIIGMIAGLLSVVPYLGTIVGLGVAVIAAFFQFHDVWHVTLVLVVFGTGQALESMVLTPKLVGDRIGLHPVMVIFAVLAGGQLFGFLGILLALPAASALNVLVRHAQDSYTSSSLYQEEKGEQIQVP